jgi:hypothetical protein
MSCIVMQATGTGNKAVEVTAKTSPICMTVKAVTYPSLCSHYITTRVLIKFFSPHPCNFVDTKSAVSSSEMYSRVSVSWMRK